LAEVVGGATESPDCGWYFFDPCLVPEVVGWRSHLPIEEGVGIVVLTALHPFQTAQPLIRYWTDDVAEVTHTRSSIPGRLAIRPLGRADLGLPDPYSDRWIVLPGPAYALLDGLAEIGRLPWFRDSPNVDPSWRLGYPQYRLSAEHSSGRTRVTLSITWREGQPRGPLSQRVGRGIRALIESQGPWDRPIDIDVCAESDVRPLYGLSHLLPDAMTSGEQESRSGGK
jgi:hypothetical protein